MSTHTARADAAGFPAAAGQVFAQDAERLARAFTSAADRLAYDFGRRLLGRWDDLPGRDQALLTEIFRQLIIEGRVMPGG